MHNIPFLMHQIWYKILFFFAGIKVFLKTDFLDIFVKHIKFALHFMRIKLALTPDTTTRQKQILLLLNECHDLFPLKLILTMYNIIWHTRNLLTEAWLYIWLLLVAASVSAMTTTYDINILLVLARQQWHNDSNKNIYKPYVLLLMIIRLFCHRQW